MRVRDHVVLTAPLALRGRRAVSLLAGAVLVDADHYLWFCIRRRQLSPLAAVRFFGGAAPPQGQSTRVLHSSGALLAVLALGLRRRWALRLATGMLIHVALDAQHEARMNRLRAQALRRDGFTCRRCGARGPDVATHLTGQPLLLPAYRLDRLVSLCGNCHEDAHAQATRRGSAEW